MPTVETQLFGPIEYVEEQLIEVRGGLPGLNHIRRLLPLAQPPMAPFVFFQAIEDPAVSMLAVPVRVVKSDFELQLSEDDCQSLELPTEPANRNPADVGGFALVAVSEEQLPTANLLAPLAIHFRKNLAVQSIQPLEEHFLRYPLDASVAGREQC